MALLGGLAVWLVAMVGLVCVVGYLLPAIIGIGRRAPDLWVVLVVNVLLGWTFVGWVVALVLACRSRPGRYYYPPINPYVGHRQ